MTAGSSVWNRITIYINVMLI